MNIYANSQKSNWFRLNNIGKGSFGLVSLAADQSGHLFAVKSVEKKSNECLRCLENEIRVLKTLSSPYVVTYLGDDVTCESSIVYRNLHMEYMPGGTLADVTNHCDFKNIRSYTWCVTSALSYIHARNIVHCDVKGANVLIGKTAGTAKLADFGSAVDVRNIPYCRTRGSPLWMAPEVVRGEYIGPESDVWSLGCTVIEMITGQPAWQDRGADTFRQIGYSDQVPELEFTAPIPDELLDFVSKCLKREKSERWSCDQLLQHPFLLSCSPPSSPQITINSYELSPRCVFDWCDSSSSCLNESTIDTCQLTMSNTRNAKQRIGKLASNTGVVWETEGWEVVRHVTATTWEYSDSVDEEENVSGSGGINWEYTEGTTNEAQGTIDGWMYRDSVDVDIHRCCMYVWLEKLFDIIAFYLNFIQRIRYTQWFTSTQSLSSLWFDNKHVDFFNNKKKQKL